MIFSLLQIRTHIHFIDFLNFRLFSIHRKMVTLAVRNRQTKNAVFLVCHLAGDAISQFLHLSHWVLHKILYTLVVVLHGYFHNLDILQRINRRPIHTEPKLFRLLLRYTSQCNHIIVTVKVEIIGLVRDHKFPHKISHRDIRPQGVFF